MGLYNDMCLACGRHAKWELGNVHATAHAFQSLFLGRCSTWADRSLSSTFSHLFLVVRLILSLLCAARARVGVHKSCARLRVCCWFLCRWANANAKANALTHPTTNTTTRRSLARGIAQRTSVHKEFRGWINVCAPGHTYCSSASCWPPPLDGRRKDMTHSASNERQRRDATKRSIAIRVGPVTRTWRILLSTNDGRVSSIYYNAKCDRREVTYMTYMFL